MDKMETISTFFPYSGVKMENQKLDWDSPVYLLISPFFISYFYIKLIIYYIKGEGIKGGRGRAKKR